MPTTYEELLAETLPGRIKNDEDYDRLRARLGELLVQRRRTRAEDRLMDLLAVLIEDYDRRHAMPPDDSTPAERLQFLVEHSGKSATELLLPIFSQRSHVNEALNGKRAISAAQARKLGQLFQLPPGLFL
jgi:antitoxin component HigA of HigAB toxin-antitoxin module